MQVKMCLYDEAVYLLNNLGTAREGKIWQENGVEHWKNTSFCPDFFAKDWGFLPAFPAPDCYTQELCFCGVNSQC